MTTGAMDGGTKDEHNTMLKKVAKGKEKKHNDGGVSSTSKDDEKEHTTALLPAVPSRGRRGWRIKSAMTTASSVIIITYLYAKEGSDDTHAS
jgi:hypothetical protein